MTANHGAMVLKSLGNIFKLTDNSFLGYYVGDDYTSNKQKDLGTLINDSYGSNSIVYAIIRKISQTMADVPLYVYDKKKEEVVTNGELVDILNTPAIYQGELLSTKEWLEILAIFLFSSGNVFQVKTIPVGFNSVKGFTILPSQKVTPQQTNSFLYSPSYYTFNDKTKKNKYNADEIVHTKFLNPTSYGINTGLGLSPLQAGIYSLIGSNDTHKALSVLMKNQGVRGILTNESDRNLDNSLISAIKRKINNTIRGIDKINSVHVSNTKMKYIPMGMSAGDLKLIESGVLTDRQICNIFGVDSKLFNDVASSTFNNVKEANKSFYQNVILPNISRFITVFNENITADFNKKNKTNLIVKYDISSIDALQVDKKELAIRQRTTADGINRILTANTDKKGKISALVYTFQMSEELATSIVSNE